VDHCVTAPGFQAAHGRAFVMMRQVGARAKTEGQGW
jgi:hypothetical protein